MPRTKSAIKALRSSMRRRAQNLVYRRAIAKLVKQARSGGRLDLAQLSQLLDKSAKVGVIHANRARRLKSRLMKRRSPIRPKAETKP